LLFLQDTTKIFTLEEIQTVTELTRAIKQQLEGRFSFICVKGEITNFRAQSSGHLYFSLKDAGATISAVLFRGSATKLTRQPKSGDTVVVKGEISLYAPRGQYQIICREVTYEGVGDLLLQLHELKARLEKEGLFAVKKPLPKHPKRIGIITSPTGAVIQDVLNVLTRRHKGLNILLRPVKVQGDGASEEIAQAIKEMNEHSLVDLLIVGRGGGSLEDLWPFNTERVGRAIAGSTIPVISAVGHQTDFSIADFCADMRAPTPSAAAELAVQERQAQLDFLTQAKSHVVYALKQKLRQSRYRLDGVMRQPIFADPTRLLAPFALKVDDAKMKIEHALLQRHHELKHKKERLFAIIQHLESIDPKNLLKRGYCIPFSKMPHSGIISKSNLAIGDRIRLLFHDGEANVKVEDV